jgi:hypothetical protein
MAMQNQSLNQRAKGGCAKYGVQWWWPWAWCASTGIGDATSDEPVLFDGAAVRHKSHGNQGKVLSELRRHIAHL